MQPRFLAQVFAEYRGRSFEETLTFARFVDLIGDALVEHQGSGRQSFTRAQEQGTLETSSEAGYGKLRRVPLSLSVGFFAEGTVRLRALLPPQHLAAELPVSVADLTVVVGDGKTLKRVAKRLLPARGAAGKVYGGKLLVAFLPSQGVAVAMAADPDGERNECRFVPQVVEQTRHVVSGPRLWVLDRQFCDLVQTARCSEDRDHFLIRYDGVRYCFKKDPNVTKLIEDAENEVARHSEEVKGRIKEMLTQRLAGHRATEVWPVKTQDLPDEDPTFLIGYLPLEFTVESKTEQERIAKDFFAKYGDRPRKYRNGVGLAIPEKKQIEALRRAVRYLLAIERVENKKQQLRLSKDQLDQLRERRRTEEAAAESALRALYTSVWLPRVEGGNLEIDPVEVGGRPLKAIGIHERIMELLMETGPRKVHGSVTPQKIIDRLRLGESIAAGEAPRLGVKAADVLEAFFAFLEPPRLDSATVLRKAIVRGVTEGVFAYTSTSGYVPALGPDGRYQLPRDKVTFGRTLSEDEIDFDSGFLLLPSAIPEEATQPSPAPVSSPLRIDEDSLSDNLTTPRPTTPGMPTPSITSTQTNRTMRLSFTATRDQVFKAFPAIANLAEKSDGGQVVIHIEATARQGFDAAWLRNAVEEPLDEGDIQWRKEDS